MGKVGNPWHVGWLLVHRARISSDETSYRRAASEAYAQPLLRNGQSYVSFEPDEVSLAFVLQVMGDSQVMDASDYRILTLGSRTR